MENIQLFTELSAIIEQGKKALATQVNSTMTMVYWHIGKRINENVLQNECAEYGKQIVVTLSRQLSWSHILILLPLKRNYRNFVLVGTNGDNKLFNKRAIL